MPRGGPVSQYGTLLPQEFLVFGVVAPLTR